MQSSASPAFESRGFEGTGNLVAAHIGARQESLHLSSAVGGFALDSGHNEPTQPTRRRNRLERLVENVERSLPLPTSSRGYLLYLCWLVLIVGGMGILTLMSAQILQARMELQRLTTDHTLIQQRNSELVWLIARETNLERVQRRLAGKGYIAATDFDYDMQYVVLGGSTPLDAPAENSLVDVGGNATTGARVPTVVAELSTRALDTASPTARELGGGQSGGNMLPAGADITPDTIALLTGGTSVAGTSVALDATALQAASATEDGIQDSTATATGVPAEPGLTAALAEGINQWELVFRNSRPAQPATGTQNAAYTTSGESSGGGWHAWWSDLRGWSRGSLTGMDSAWPWSGE